MMKTVLDYRDAARKKLSEALFDYIEKAAGFGDTYANNLAAFKQYQFIPRVLQGIDKIDVTTTLLNRRIAAPIIIAPTAFHGMFCEEGEKATAEATRRFGIPFVISSFSTRDFHEIGEERSHVWYQLLLYKDKSMMRQYIKKAEDARCSAIVLTVDAQYGCSMCKSSSGTSVAFPIHQLPIFPKNSAVPFDSLDDYYKKYLATNASWDEVFDIVSSTKLPVILKGILHPCDVEQAINCGIQAIIISNHGGRQFDNTLSTLDALKHISDDIKSRIDVYLDGGIRSGSDILKALAMGARAVLIGRPALYGLAVNGEEGLFSILTCLSQELSESMYMNGFETLKDINKTCLFDKNIR